MQLCQKHFTRRRLVLIVLGFFGYPAWSGLTVIANLLFHSNSNASLIAKVLGGFIMGFTFGLLDMFNVIVWITVTLYEQI
jgi:hypothetical protein